jgi:sulfotransferase family protein
LVARRPDETVDHAQPTGNPPNVDFLGSTVAEQGFWPRSTSGFVARNLRSPILIFGLPRSGTTWLAKLFDSHPDTLYRHEPDIELREDRLPHACRPEDWPAHRDLARQYLLRLFDTRTVRTAGPPPNFDKSFRSQAAHILRAASIFALRGGATVPRVGEVFQHIPVSDFIPTQNRLAAQSILKSVSAEGRVGLFAEALPESRIIFLIRHPCGQIASRLRGITLGRMGMPVNPGDAVEFTSLDQAKAHNLTAEKFEAMAPLEQLAWYWVILNEKAIADLADRSRARIVRYEDLCARPLATTQDLFGFVGLDWHSQTGDFITESTSYTGFYRYFGVRRNSPETADKWRSTLSPDEQERILAVARRSAAGAMYGGCCS